MAVLSGLGTHGTAVVPIVAALLAHRNGQVRQAAADTLEGLGPAAAAGGDGVAAIAAVLSIPDQMKRNVDGSPGPVVPGSMARRLALSTLARLSPELVRSHAAEVASLLGHRESGLAGDDDREVRRQCISLLGVLGTAAAPHAAVVICGLDDPDDTVRQAAAAAIAALGENLANGAVELAARLEAVEPRVREAAAIGFGSLGNAATPHTKALGACLDDPVHFVRQAAVRQLARLAKDQFSRGHYNIIMCRASPTIFAHAIGGSICRVGRRRGKSPQ